jgi:hypothetical protein
VDVTVALYTTSRSAGWITRGAVGTEAVLDGQPGGLQVTVIDTTTRKRFVLGWVSCYTDPTETSPASYPDAAFCTSSSSFQTVATSVQNASFSNNFLIYWSFPASAGNPYQGSAATIIIEATFTGAASGEVLGASTGPNGGQLAASTPTTGAALPEVLGTLLPATGIFLVLTGALLYRRRPRFGDGRPPTLAPSVG